jgi:hypothetical protein
MTRDEIAPFIGKCVAVYIATGDVFQGFLKNDNDAYKVDAGSSQASIDGPDAIDRIELLKT